MLYIYSARISNEIATAAARALTKSGLGISRPLRDLTSGQLDLDEYLAAAPMCAEAFLTILEGSKPRPEETFRLYRLSPKGTWEDDLFRGRNDRSLRLAIVASSSSAPEATWPELERARRFMPKILILALCGRCNLLIPVFCTGLERADWVVA